jgi:hypothetical protein
MRSLMAAAALAALCATTACSTPGRPAGALSSYDGLSVRGGTVRTGISERKDAAALTQAQRVWLLPAELQADAPWMSEQERRLLLREVDAQVCFEFTERYAVAPDPASADATVRTVVTRVQPTGRVASAASAAAAYLIPGPIGLRAPGTTGGLGVEAEVLGPNGEQLAALVWSRDAQPIGTDNPSLSRIGDALQLAEPFADTAAEVMSARPARAVPSPDPCAQYGPRFRVEGWLTRFATGLYVPETSAARPAPASPSPAPN